MKMNGRCTLQTVEINNTATDCFKTQPEALHAHCKADYCYHEEMLVLIHACLPMAPKRGHLPKHFSLLTSFDAL